MNRPAQVRLPGDLPFITKKAITSRRKDKMEDDAHAPKNDKGHPTKQTGQQPSKPPSR